MAKQIVLTPNTFPSDLKANQKIKVCVAVKPHKFKFLNDAAILAKPFLDHVPYFY
jgi:hypothetical protein